MRILKGALCKRKLLLFRLTLVVLTLAFTVTLMSQAAFARTTYRITDGDLVLTHTTYATDPAAVLSEAGLTLGASDTFTAETHGEVPQITIKRIQMVHVHHQGDIYEVATYGSTVRAILTQLNIPITQDLRISQELDAETYEGMDITVTYLEYREEEYYQELPYETVYCLDESLQPDEERVLVAGVTGSMWCKDQVTYEEGLEIGRTRLEEVVLENPVNAVIAQGIDRSTKEQEGDDRVYVGILDSLGFGSDESPGPGGAVVADNGYEITTADGTVIPYRRKLAVEATAYCKQGPTAVGTTARYGAIAVDPRVIPYGTEMYIVSSDGQYIYGYATAEDCGNFEGYSIDLFFNDEDFCWEFGRRRCTVYILGSGK